MGNMEIWRKAKPQSLFVVQKNQPNKAHNGDSERGKNNKSNLVKSILLEHVLYFQFRGLLLPSSIDPALMQRLYSTYTSVYRNLNISIITLSTSKKIKKTKHLC